MLLPLFTFYILHALFYIRFASRMPYYPPVYCVVRFNLNQPAPLFLTEEAKAICLTTLEPS
jgi:hypothetical protein